MVKLFLIALFPWLIFFVFAGKWKIILAWWAVYFSFLLWTPLWTLLYHLMISIAHSTELLHAYDGSLSDVSDGISLYSANFISTRFYQFYAIYSWLQMIVGPLPTVLLAWGMFTGFFLRIQKKKGHQREQVPSSPLQGPLLQVEPLLGPPLPSKA